MDSTPQFNRSFTPALVAAFIRQSMIVCEELVVGNIRPSLSVFSFTPRATNQSTVSRAENFWNGASSARSPRG